MSDGRYSTKQGLNEDIVREISSIKKEPDWMLQRRLEGYHNFANRPLPNFGPKLTQLNFDDYTYYIRSSEKSEKDWDKVPTSIKDTFSQLGILEAEQKFLAGVSTQYESEVVYHNMLEEAVNKGVLFTDTDTALKMYPEIFKKFFGSVVKPNDNKFSALNDAVWSGGSFIYVPPYTELTRPLQSYFRINTERMGQFERTLIIVDEGASLHYVEGCTAPIYSKDSLHAAVVEIIVKKGAKCRYTTIQNWSSNIINLVTKRAIVEEDGLMEWIDGNIGSGINMKYPACILVGERAKASCISIAVASKNQIQDAGAKMIHLAKNTSSSIIAKSIAKLGGVANYRGTAVIGKDALNSKTHIQCDTLLLDQFSKSDTLPINIVHNNQSSLEHEATVSKISTDQLFYLMSKGLTEHQATSLIVLGFLEEFSRELPMEYAVELNQLLKLYI
jgi:Fe-S cluster assembly protein SufB